MSIRRLQGWALIISGLLGLLAILRSDSPVIKTAFLVGAVLLILGVPAVEAVQRMGWLGILGIILIVLGALVALVLNLIAPGGAVPASDALPFAGALAGGLGRIIVGWLTGRERVFPAWAGWAFILEGALNFLGGVIQVPALGPLLGVLVPLAGTIALVGYGMVIARREPSVR